jgi:hypothetical protein
VENAWTLFVARSRAESGHGDPRNKIKHLEDLARQARQFRQLQARSAARRPITCQCGNAHPETNLTAYSGYRDVKLNGVFCISCLPTEHKMELIGDMVNNGIKYDAAEHGDA